MIAQPISYKRLHEALYRSFKDDKDIFKYFDPNVNAQTVEDIVIDIEKKIREYGDNAKMRGIYEKGKLIGYFIIYHDMLVSFSLAVEYRKQSFLSKFFSIIKKELNNQFGCYLWTRNVRAIKWLLKNGMKITHSDKIITKLICL